MKAIAVTGMPGSGKEEFVKVALNEGITVVRMGDIVREEVRRKGLDLTDDNVGAIANEEREKFGYGIWAKRTLPLITGDRVLIDGIRGDAELKVFRDSLGHDMVVVGIHSSPRTRYERIVKRNRKDTTLTWETFTARDGRELSWGIGKAIALCDRMIVNEGTLEEFRENIRSLIRAL